MSCLTDFLPCISTATEALKNHLQAKTPKHNFQRGLTSLQRRSVHLSSRRRSPPIYTYALGAVRDTCTSSCVFVSSDRSFKSSAFAWAAAISLACACLSAASSSLTALRRASTSPDSWPLLCLRRSRIAPRSPCCSRCRCRCRCRGQLTSETALFFATQIAKYIQVGRCSAHQRSSLCFDLEKVVFSESCSLFLCAPIKLNVNDAFGFIVKIS